MKHVYTSFLTFTLLTLTATGVYAQGPNDSGTYYAAADGKKGYELKTALCGIIRAGLEDNVVSYTPGLWNAYPKTDAKPDDNTKVWDMYSNTTNFTFGDDQDKGSGGTSEGQFYNREHSFPREWFGGAKAPMNTDLFHVYPTDKLVNNKRSSFPYGETTGEDYTLNGKNLKGYKSNNDFSKLGLNTYSDYEGTVFEPNDIYKGDFARSYFYMVTCYESELPTWTSAQEHTLDGTTGHAFKDWQLNMLMKWAKNDEVSEKETNRNKEVYKIQSNRNPFIDYPGLEEYIWGDLVNVAFSYDDYKTPTAIMTIKTEPTYKEGVMYNLSGQVVDKSYKGIVIMNGKKFVNK